jgi:hypothetical protein
MDIRKELHRKIEKKRQEIELWNAEIKEFEIKIRMAAAYVSGLEDTLKLLPKENPSDAALALRPDSAVAKSRELILNAGRPLHVNELLSGLGKPNNHNTKAALSGSLAAYARKNQVFTRPAPNTFGLVEMEAQPARQEGDDLPLDFGVVKEKKSDAA